MINIALKSCIPRLDIQRAFFLTFLSKINCSTRNFEVSGGIRLSWALVSNDFPENTTILFTGNFHVLA